MARNVGQTDRITRFIVAIAALLLAFFVAGPTSVGGIILIIIAIVMAVTALTSTCPIYKALGVSTCKTSDS